MTYVIACDVGTSGIKTCVYRIDGGMELVGSLTAGYGLQIGERGEAEQDPHELWQAMCTTTTAVVREAGISPAEVEGISFCSQMQSLILVDAAGEPVRPSMSYMDQRATAEMAAGIGRGLKISGMNARKLLSALRVTGAAPASVKDPVWKYNWVKANEPSVFARVATWLDVKEYLILRCTGERVMTRDSAFATLLYDARPGHEEFSAELCRMFGVSPSHLPRVVGSSERVGGLTATAAAELGLAEGTAVFGGGGDASLIGVGAGAAQPGDTHIYFGTSGWVSTVVTERKVDINAMIASIVGASAGSYNYFAELETAGKCLEWVRDHLALDEINLYLEQRPELNERIEKANRGLYSYMIEEISSVPAGSGGVVFTPWLHGNRCPFEDPNAAGMFFNIRLETGKRELIHSVLEGVCYHLRWQLEAQEKKVTTSPVVRFVGGGALAPLTCQMLANILGRPVETVASPQNVGALGAAIVVGVGLGILDSIEDADRLVPALATYRPDPAVKAVHDRNFGVLKELYRRNRKLFATMNEVE